MTQQPRYRFRVPTLQEAAAALPMMPLLDLEMVLQVLEEKQGLQSSRDTPGKPSARENPYSGTTCLPKGYQDDESQDIQS